MKPESFAHTLTQHLGARREGPVFAIPADAELTVIVALSGETLALSRVARVELDLGDTVAIVDGARGERTVVAVEDVLALKLEGGERRRDRGAGFGK